jgi:hypothetical protein
MHLLVGSLDTMLATDLEPLHAQLKTCDSEHVWELREGVTHTAILANVERESGAILGWLLGHRRACGR